jgi:hypothetical protein
MEDTQLRNTNVKRYSSFMKIKYTALTMTVSMGSDYVSELRPPAGLMFIPQLIYAYKYGEPWWNDTDRRKLLIRLPEL